MNLNELEFDNELWSDIMDAIDDASTESQLGSGIDLAIHGRLFLENL